MDWFDSANMFSFVNASKCASFSYVSFLKIFGCFDQFNKKFAPYSQVYILLLIWWYSSLIFMILGYITKVYWMEICKTPLPLLWIWRYSSLILWYLAISEKFIEWKFVKFPCLCYVLFGQICDSILISVIVLHGKPEDGFL